MTSFAPHGFLVKRCTKAVTEPDITSRAILPPNTAPPNGSSSSAGGGRGVKCTWAKRGGNLHRLYDAGVPGQVHAIYGRTSGEQGFRRDQPSLWKVGSRFARHYRKDCR